MIPDFKNINETREVQPSKLLTGQPNPEPQPEKDKAEGK